MSFAAQGKTVPSVFTDQLGGTQESQIANFASASGYIECETPNAATNKFVGKLCVEGKPDSPLSVSNVLLRGSSVRNSEYAIGLVINTGSDTKVMQGARKSKTKESGIDKNINPIIGGVCILLVQPRLLTSSALRCDQTAPMPPHR